MRKEEALVHFSIVTVVRNDLPGLKRTRASLNKQKYKNWTHIIVDGGSTDGTLEYLNALPKKNTSFISEQDEGIYDAMNKGWKMADPDSFVYFLNARDLFADLNSD
jgi:putative colanic acid biosynthesis glycosyltransferase